MRIAITPRTEVNNIQHAARVYYDRWPEEYKEENMSKKRRLASVTSAGLVFAMLLSQSSVTNLGAEVVKAADDTEKWVDTGYVVNGDFANADTVGADWTISIPQDKATWKYGSGAENGYYCIWGNQSDTPIDVSVSQTVKLSAGTYKVAMKSTGRTNGLKLKAGEYVSSDIEASMWSDDKNDWILTETGEFTLDEANDVVISVEGTTDTNTKDGCAIDDIVLYQKETSDDKDDSEENQEGYKISVDKTEVTVEKGENVGLTAKVTYNGEELSELPDGVSLWWWVDIWNDHKDGLNDGTLNNDDNSGKTLKADYTTKSAGKYYIVAELQDADKNTLVSETVTITSTEPDSAGAVDNDDITVAKVKDLSSDFIMGMDISSVITEFNSGVVYKDYDGNVIDNVTDFCKFLSANGITHIRVRVWNDPYDSKGNGYGGGNNDVATAKKIADACRAAGINMLVDFHCSDFWADPSKQMVPKAWEGYTVDQKAEAVEKFINESLQTIDPTKDVVDMVQVGNETTGSFIGEKNVADMCKLFSAGSNGVKTYNKDVKVVIHVESPQKSTLTKWSDNLANYDVDYDILGTSYYPYWHGTLANLEEQIKYVQTEHNKDAMVVETSYAYTLDDSDGSANTVREGNNDDAADATEPFTVQGQATYIRNLINAVNEAGGLGVFYWEPAWITVGDTTGLSEEDAAARYEENKKIWEKYGSGWASSYGGEYDPKDAGQWYGGSAVDNQAMFYPDGTATAGLKVWNYVKTGAIVTKIGVENIEDTSVIGIEGQDITLPETVNVTYNTETVAEKVTWNTDGVDLTKAGTYTVEGTFDFSKEIERGAYKGMKSATVKCTVVVKLANLIKDNDDAGFEKGDNFTVSDSSVISGIPAVDDPKSGVGSAHWYNGGSEAADATITYNKAITLAAGDYTFEYVGQGASGDAIYAKVVDADGNVIAQSENIALDGWKNWKYPTASFKLDKETSVTLVVGIISAAGGWGTADDLYLYQTKSADTSETPSIGDKKDDNSGETGDVVNPDKKDDKDSKKNDSTNTGADTSTTVKIPTTTDKTLTAGAVVSSAADSKTTVKDTKGILPATVKFDSKKVTDEKKVSEVTKVVNDKIVGVKDVAIYELNLTDGTTQLHQLADKVQVTMDMPFTLAENEAVKVFRVDGEKLTACKTSVVDGKLVFETDHFSTFAFVKVKASAAKTAKTAKSAKTSDENNMYMWLVLAMAGIGVTVAASKKKQHI